MRCQQCSEVRGYPFKRSHLVALRATKMTASDPPSSWLRAIVLFCELQVISPLEIADQSQLLDDGHRRVSNQYAGIRW